MNEHLAWEQSPAAWDAASEAYAREIAPRTALFAADLLALLPLAPTSRFLDVASGTGAVALAAARAGASVTAVDFSPGMTRGLAGAARSAGFAIDARTMDGQRLAFADRSFDAAASLFGLQFFIDRAAGLRELRRVVVPGGLVAVGAWCEPERVELMAPLRRALARALPHFPVPRSTAFFSFAAEDRLANELRAAEFTDIDVHERDHPQVFATAAAYWCVMESASPGPMELFARLTTEECRALRAAVFAELYEFFGTRPIVLRATARIAVARA